ncbi:MAG TPA: zinc-binding dehydrogenase [Stellaceae bacterium]|nr:zinc-binding dehydrogenase [Stellaceae bacterium]
MLALVNTPNGPAPVELREVAEPSPARDEAVVAIHAFSLNRGELTLMRIRPEGWRPGQDVSGVVVRAAADGSGPKEGTRVVALIDGAGWAERAAASVHRVAPLPDGVSYAAAAALPVAGITALRTLRYGEPLIGRRVLVTGAAGGVGNLAVQLAARSGARVTAVVGRPGRGRNLAFLGAAELVEGIDKADGRYALVLESAGGASLAEAIKRLEPRGTVVIFGNSSGEPTSIGFRDFGEHNNARIQSFHSFTSGPEEQFAPDLGLLVGLVADGSLKPQIGSERSWRDLPQVAVELRERRVDGKAIFRVEQR